MERRPGERVVYWTAVWRGPAPRWAPVAVVWVGGGGRLLNPRLSGLLGGYRRRGLFPGGEGEAGDWARSPAEAGKLWRAARRIRRDTFL